MREPGSGEWSNMTTGLHRCAGNPAIIPGMSQVTAVSPTPEPNPGEALLLLAGAFLPARCLQVVADIGVADALGEAPASAAQLAAETGVDPGALARVLNLIAAHGVFAARGDLYEHTEMSRLLRSDHPRSVRSLVQLLGFPPMWAAADQLPDAVRTGTPDINRISPGGFWGYLERTPESAHIFNEAMTAKAAANIPAITACYDFSSFRTIADVGGGRGHLLRAVLAAFPQTEGILVDLPHVIEDASREPSDRLRFHSADFFRDQLPSSDAYILMEVIHDWGDEESVAILRTVRRSAPAGARLLIIEAPVPEDPQAKWVRTLDMLMFSALGGSQRTLGEYKRLMQQSGFRFERVVDTKTALVIVEGTAA